MGFINTGEIGQHTRLLPPAIIPACAEPRAPVDRIPASVTLLQPAPGLQQYREALASHDWAFEWSDDSRRVAEGRASLERIARMQRKYDPDFEVWNELAPEICRRGGSHKASTLDAMRALIDAAGNTLDYSTELRGAIARAHTAWVQAGGERQS